jgi:hypothetical protein
LLHSLSFPSFQVLLDWFKNAPDAIHSILASIQFRNFAAFSGAAHPASKTGNDARQHKPLLEHIHKYN